MDSIKERGIFIMHFGRICERKVGCFSTLSTPFHFCVFLVPSLHCYVSTNTFVTVPVLLKYCV
jgi:hypothetical protein